jgi:hypothetical protein
MARTMHLKQVMQRGVIPRGKGCAELSYWTEEWDYANAKVWVNVTSIPAGASTIRMWYGNPSATCSSNGDATFILFDDFSADRIGTTWITDGGSWSISGDVLTGGVGGGTFGALRLKDTISNSSGVRVIVDGESAISSDILSYYRSLGSNPNTVETTDLLKAADDWSSDTAPPGFSAPITTVQLLALADKWSRS